jgi:hypothetical protein
MMIIKKQVCLKQSFYFFNKITLTEVEIMVDLWKNVPTEELHLSESFQENLGHTYDFGLPSS